MTPGPPLHCYTLAEYLSLEESSNVRHEYLEGEIYAMAGGTPEHAALSAAISASLLTELRGGSCKVFSSDLRIRVQATGLVTYPDVSVVCGPLRRDAESASTVLNPKVVVEVTSPSTEQYDRAEKLRHYQRIDELSAIVLVSHREKKIELWLREGDGWVRTEARSGEEIRITPLGVSLSVDEIYANAAV